MQRHLEVHALGRIARKEELQVRDVRVVGTVLELAGRARIDFLARTEQQRGIHCGDACGDIDASVAPPTQEQSRTDRIQQREARGVAPHEIVFRVPLEPVRRPRALSALEAKVDPQHRHDVVIALKRRDFKLLTTHRLKQRQRGARVDQKCSEEEPFKVGCREFFLLLGWI